MSAVDGVSIGVDLGGTNLRVAAFTAGLERLGSHTLPTRLAAGPQAVVADIAHSVHRMYAELGTGRSIAGVGVGSPGPLDLPAGTLHNPPNLPGFDGLELKLELEKLLPWPVVIESDANAAAYGELVAGAALDCNTDSLCMITLGTGVGGGIVLNRQLWHGMTGMAGEIGHGPLISDGPVCSCGAQGCLELYASATAVVRHARALAMEGSAAAIRELMDREPNFSARDVARLASGGDHATAQIFSRVGEVLGLSLANLVNTLNLPLYVIGGGLAAAWRLFAPELFRSLAESSYVYRQAQPRDPYIFEAGKTHVVPSRLGSEAGLVGAAMLPFTNFHG